MICFEVARNGERLCTAGIGEDGVLHATVGLVTSPESETRNLYLHVGGLHQPQSDLHVHPTWVDLHDIAIGDEITIRIGECGIVDRPAREKRQTDAEIRQQQRQYHEQVKKEFEEEA